MLCRFLGFDATLHIDSTLCLSMVYNQQKPDNYPMKVVKKAITFSGFHNQLFAIN